MAAPIVSGSAAILMSEMTKQFHTFDPFVIKNILMSTATDLQNDPFTQGSGLVNVESALKYVYGHDGVFIVHNNSSYGNIKKILEPAIKNINSTSVGFDQFQFPDKSFPMTSWFAGQLISGEKVATTFTINNPTNSTITINVNPKMLSLISTTEFHGTTTPRQQDFIQNKNDTFIPNYVKLSDIHHRNELGAFFNAQNPIPEDTSLMILNVNFPFSEFMNGTANVYADDIKISSLYLYDWLDNDNNTRITSDELSMVNRSGSWGTVQELRVSEPKEKFDGTPLVGVYPVHTRYSYWLGDTQQNSTSMDYTLSASYYQKNTWPLLVPESKIISVLPNDSTSVNVLLETPDDLQTGVYQGFLSFESDYHSVNAPVSFVIKEPITNDDSTILIKGINSTDVLYGSGYTKGAFDMVNRYMAGDWRQYYFDIQSESINSAAIELSWFSDDTNLSVFVMNPAGEIIQTNVPSGVFGEFMGWSSLDWLGNSVFSEGGGFYPVKNKDDTSTVLHVPINQTGTYTLLTHTTLFGGNSTTEPITIAAKFVDISSEIIPENIIISQNMSTIADPVPLDRANSEPQISSKNDTVLNSSTDSSLNYGILIGLVIGITIGIVALIILRQKPLK